MKQYQVTFCYSLVIPALDENSAEEKAWEMFSQATPRSKDFAAVVEESNEA